MSLKWIKLSIFLFILNFFVCSYSMAAMAEIWSENFNGYAQGTIEGANNNTANSAEDWTINTADSDPKWFEVRNNQNKLVMAGKDTDGPVSWVSEWISISGWDNVRFSLNVGGTGGQDDDDYIEVLYRLDESLPLKSSFKKTGDFKEDGVSQDVRQDVVGDLLQIIIKIDNDHEDEFHYFDDVLVEGSPVPVPTSILLLGSGIVALIRFRRKVYHKKD